MMTVEEIVDNFSYLDDWEDKYRYLIELGEGLPPFPEALKVEANKVDGCMSQVWLYPSKEGEVYHFAADSDAMIVKGLIAVILAAYSGKTADEIQKVDIDGIFKTLGLDMNLSPTRRNGFFAMVEKIKSIASSIV